MATGSRKGSSSRSQEDSLQRNSDRFITQWVEGGGGGGGGIMMRRQEKEQQGLHYYEVLIIYAVQVDLLAEGG